MNAISIKFMMSLSGRHIGPFTFNPVGPMPSKKFLRLYLEKRGFKLVLVLMRRKDLFFKLYLPWQELFTLPYTFIMVSSNNTQLRHFSQSNTNHRNCATQATPPNITTNNTIQVTELKIFSHDWTQLMQLLTHVCNMSWSIHTHIPDDLLVSVTRRSRSDESHSLTYLLTYLLSVSIDFTDVTLVSDDTYRRLYWCDPDDPDESYLVMKVI